MLWGEKEAKGGHKKGNKGGGFIIAKLVGKKGNTKRRPETTHQKGMLPGAYGKGKGKRAKLNKRNVRTRMKFIRVLFSKNTAGRLSWAAWT